MTDQDTLAPTLFELLAREWTVGCAVQSLLFNGRQTSVGYVLADGSLAIAYVSDEDPADERIHINAEDGRSMIRPRTKSPRPLVMVDVSDDSSVLFETWGKRDFFAGKTGGPFYRVSPLGDKTEIRLPVDEPVFAVADCKTGESFACVAGNRVIILHRESMAVERVLEQGCSIGAVAFSQGGELIAVAHADGLTIWDLSEPSRKARDFAFGGDPNRIFWSPDGEWIAIALADGGVQLVSAIDNRSQAITGFPAPVGSVAWNESKNALVAAGAFRVAAWSMMQPPIGDTSLGAFETGKTGFVSVRAVTCHPGRDLIAAGYDNGFLSIMQIGVRDEMVLNSEDRGACRGLSLVA